MSKVKQIFSRIMAIEPIKRQSIVSFFWKIVLTLIGFLSTMYFAHTVGAGVLGGYFLFIAYFNIINLASDGGLGGAAIKRISEAEEEDAYFSAFLVLRSLFLTVIIVILIAFRNYFVDINEAGVFNWLVLALIVSLIYGTLNNAILGRGKVGIQSTCIFISEFTRILLQIIAVLLGYGIAGLAGGFVVGMIAASIIELRFLDLRFVHFEWRHLKSLSEFSFWVFLTSSGIMIYSYADTIMIGYYMGNYDVGIYQIAMQFASITMLVTTSLLITLWPRVSHWEKMGDIRYIQKSLSKAITYSLLFAIPLCIGGILLGEELLYYFYGADFAQGYTVLAILLVVQIISVFQFFFLHYLTALNLQKKAFRVTAISANANILLNALLIPIIGITGAAIATFVTLSLNAFLAKQVLSKAFTIELEHETLRSIIKASAVMGFLVGVYKVYMPLSDVGLTLGAVIIGVVVYGFLILKLDKRVYEELKGVIVQML